jgi:hypothetical protein
VYSRIKGKLNVLLAWVKPKAVNCLGNTRPTAAKSLKDANILSNILTVLHLHILLTGVLTPASTVYEYDTRTCPLLWSFPANLRLSSQVDAVIMLEQVIQCLTPGYTVLGFISFGILIQALIQIRYELKVRKAGGIHAAQLAKDPITALFWLGKIGWAQSQDRLFDLFQSMMITHTSQYFPNTVELNVTGGQRYIFTREPEHIKTILTGKFANFGKGEKFHRVWVSEPS